MSASPIVRSPLYTWRKAAGMTQADMAAQVGQCLSGYKRIERHPVNLPGEIAEIAARLIAARLGCRVDPYRDLYRVHCTPTLLVSRAARHPERQSGGAGPEVLGAPRPHTSPQRRGRARWRPW